MRCNHNQELAGLKHIRIHDFRHSCASLLINSSASVTMAAKYLGHTKIEETLNTYSHLFQCVLDGVINIINDLNKKIKLMIYSHQFFLFILLKLNSF